MIHHHIECVVAALRWRPVWLYLVAALVIGAVVGFYYVSQFIADAPPFIFKSTALQTTLRPGDALRFRVVVSSQPPTNCVGYTSREFSHLISVDDESLWEVMRLPLVGPPMFVPNQPAYVASIPLPLNATPGKWRFMGGVTYDCGFWAGGMRRYEAQPMLFEIIP